MEAILNQLRAIAALSAVPQEQLEWLIANAALQHYAVGDFLFKPGTDVDSLQIILDGLVRSYIQTGSQERELYVYEAGAILGRLPYSRMKEARAFGEVRKPLVLLALHRDKFRELTQLHYELTEVLVGVMTERNREFTTLQQQNEKLASLGRLSAGLAHELNNPAAAIVRSSQELKKHLNLLPHNFKRVIAMRLSESSIDAVNDRLFARLAEKPTRTLTLMEKTALEDQIVDWLEDHDVADGYDMAENLIEFGFRIEDLEYIAEHTGNEYVAPVIKWVNDNLTTERMVSEMYEAAQRISSLVQSVKRYTYMDRAADKQRVNIHEGIRNTVTMLQHKFKKFNVRFVEQFDEHLPEIEGFPGELNQVWTNLLDNALDAVAERSTASSAEEFRNGGEIIVETCNDGGTFARVSIIDNGSGIPAHILGSIFDPFFTTKSMGQGTGMGLDVVLKIVRRHHADIKVTSKPGRTEFTLCFPIQAHNAEEKNADAKEKYEA